MPTDEEPVTLVPQSLAAAVFNATLLYFDAQRRANGGALTPEARTLLDDLNRAASKPVSPTKPAGDNPANVMLGMEEVAALMGCTPQWARRLAARGDLSGAQRVGRIWLVPASSLDAFHHERQEGTHGKPGPTPPAEPH